VTAALPGDAEMDKEPAHEPTASLLLINASIGRRRDRAMVPLGPGGSGPARAIGVCAHRPRVGAGAARGDADADGGGAGPSDAGRTAVRAP